MLKSDFVRTMNLASLGRDVDRLAVAFRAADSISEGLRALDSSGLRQSLGAFDERRAAMASALKPLEDRRRAGWLLAESPLMRDIQRTGELMTGWESRHRVPEIAEIGSLLAGVQKSPWSEAIATAMPQTSRLADALAEMTKPWLNMQEPMRSIAGLAELHDIGRVLGGMQGFPATPAM